MERSEIENNLIASGVRLEYFKKKAKDEQKVIDHYLNKLNIQ